LQPNQQTGHAHSIFTEVQADIALIAENTDESSKVPR
jgi:hypothetical protein